MGGSPRRSRALRIAAGITALVMVSLGLLLWAAYRSLDANITTIDPTAGLGDVRPAKENQSMDILVIGSDSREGANSAIGGESPGLADTVLVVHLSADNSWAAAVSIPRDSMVEMPDCFAPDGRLVPGAVRQFNSAYSIGGPACVQRTVESLTDLRIDDFVVVDFVGFTAMVDAIGGVPIYIEAPISDPHSKIFFDPGCQVLDGKESLDYVRVRKGVEGGDGSDISRIERQQQFLVALIQKVTSAQVLFNPVELYAFLEAATESLTTSPGLGSIRSMASVAIRAREVGLDRIEFTTVPVEAYPPDPNRLQWAQPEADELWERLRTDQPLTPVEPSPSASPSGSAGTASASASPSGSPSAAPTASPSASPSASFNTTTADGQVCTVP
jgi:LCP family protein required for cell wall assembly